MGKATRRQYFAALSSQLSAMMVGAAFVWFTPLLEKLKQDGSRVPMTDEESSWVVSFIEIGELFSPLPAGMLLNRIGRKTVLLSSFPMMAISWILVVSTSSVEYLYAVRFLQGMAMGVAFTACPVYLAEIADPKIRGALCGNFQTMWSLGILFSYVTGPFMTYETYAYTNAGITFLFAVTYLWAPESPYYLVMANKKNEARESLKYFRDSNDVEEELSSITRTVKCYGEKNAKWADLLAKEKKTLIVVTSVAFVKYMSGIAAITTYLTETLTNSVPGSVDKNYITIGIGVVMLIATLVSAYVADAIGRRPLIILSTLGCIFFNAVAGVYFLLVKLETPHIDNYSWVAYTSIGVYCIINNIGLSPLLQTLQAECFSSETRGLAGGFISFSGTILIFISLKQYQPIQDGVGVYMNYFLFSIYSILGSIAIIAFMKETAGKSLSQIQETDSKLMEKESLPK